MNKCLVCNKTIETTLFHILYFDYKLCQKCLNKFKTIKKEFLLQEKQCFIVYEYNDFFKDLLFMFKGKNDYALKDTFLNINLPILKKRYKGYTIVPAPSFVASDELRGYNHLKEIFSQLKLPIVNCFIKTSSWKQTEKAFVERANIKKYIEINLSKLKTVNKILLVDDVATSFSTLKSMLNLLPSHKEVKILVLSSNYFVNDQ